MPCAVIGSLNQPASPTSAQPGPTRRPQVAGDTGEAAHRAVEPRGRELGCQTWSRLREQPPQARVEVGAEGGEAGRRRRWPTRTSGRRWSGSRLRSRAGGSTSGSGRSARAARTSDRRRTRPPPCPPAAWARAPPRRWWTGCRRPRRRGPRWRETASAPPRQPIDADDPARGVALYPGDADAEPHVGACGAGGIDQDRVEHGPPRRAQGGHPAPGRTSTTSILSP